jgi:hypothetical protein
MVVSDLLTLGGAAAVVTIAVEVIKRATAMSDAAITRFGPLLSVGLGIAFVCGAALAKGAPLDEAILTGLLAGAAASGIYSFAKGVRS